MAVTTVDSPPSEPILKHIIQLDICRSNDAVKIADI